MFKLKEQACFKSEGEKLGATAAELLVVEIPMQYYLFKKKCLLVNP